MIPALDQCHHNISFLMVKSPIELVITKIIKLKANKNFVQITRYECRKKDAKPEKRDPVSTRTSSLESASNDNIRGKYKNASNCRHCRVNDWPICFWEVDGQQDPCCNLTGRSNKAKNDVNCYASPLSKTFLVSFLAAFG